jgi:hypothetical protein
MKSKKQSIIRAVALWLVLLIFMMLTTPQKMPVLLLVVPFVLLFAALMSTWVALVPIARRIVGQRGYAGSPRLRITICGSIVLILVLQSLGQLTLRDLITIIAIAVIGYVYIGRSHDQSRGN